MDPAASPGRKKASSTAAALPVDPHVRRGGRTGLDLLSECEVRSATWRRLMIAAQDGDADAYRELLGEVTPLLRRWAVAELGESRRVEPAVQEVLLVLHAVRQTYEPSRPFGAWLCALARARLSRFDRNTPRRPPVYPAASGLFRWTAGNLSAVRRNFKIGGSKPQAAAQATVGSHGSSKLEMEP